MERTSGKIKTLVAAAAGAVLAGLAALLHGIMRDDLPRSIGGLALIVIGLTVIVLAVIRRWVTDTRQERILLAASQREAQGQRSQYFAAQAALAAEQSRLKQNIDAERHALAARLKAERETMAREFEERRATVIAETMEATVRMFQNGKFAPAETVTGNLIEFPRQHPERQPEQARSREHGVVGP
ncbi:hypothetical protein AB0911_08155 [Streptomyces nigra]|uniref:hypothetical protein n=1 Tax=Streptomyces nigra TaxID=1827580 RepID=UPI0034524906